MLRPMLSLRLMSALALLVAPQATSSPEEARDGSGAPPWRPNLFGSLIDPSRTHCIQAPLSMRTGHKSRVPHQFA